jgi:serine/threonine protein kinase
VQADVLDVQRWRRIKELVHEALTLSKEERGRYLDETCGSDSELRAEVEGLLKSCEEAEDFLETPITLGQGGEQETGAVTIEINSWFGPYKILERLGNGGMGVVFRAHDPKLERDVALKFLSADLADDSKACERLYREARATSALKHPNIRTVYDICDYAGQTFIVLEFLEGKPLDRREQKSLPIPELLSIAKQICSALSAAHAKGIIHRDIKPGNVFIDEHGKVSVLDFGIAKVISRRDFANATSERHHASSNGSRNGLLHVTGAGSR